MEPTPGGSRTAHRRLVAERQRWVSLRLQMSRSLAAVGEARAGLLLPAISHVGEGALEDVVAAGGDAGEGARGGDEGLDAAVVEG